MASINGKELTPEVLRKAMECKDAEELLALAKSEGVEITKEEAKAYIEELSDIELDEEMLKSVAGGEGLCYMEDCPKHTMQFLESDE